MATRTSNSQPGRHKGKRTSTAPVTDDSDDSFVVAANGGVRALDQCSAVLKREIGAVEPTVEKLLANVALRPRVLSSTNRTADCRPFRRLERVHPCGVSRTRFPLRSIRTMSSNRSSAGSNKFPAEMAGTLCTKRPKAAFHYATASFSTTMMRGSGQDLQTF